MQTAAGNMSYQLHVPPGRDGAYCALLMMLHGCAQTPSDLAQGTRMNAFADQHGFLVLYPAQSAAANPMHCWNWFDRKDQNRGAGEPDVLAQAAREVASTHGIDARRVFVAGMSAGGAMAVILGAAYPDVFAAVGVHSGLPYGAAHDAATALAAMRGGPAEGAGPGGRGGAAPSHAMPTIAFHGDADATVDVSNGAAIADQAARLAERSAGPLRRSESGGQASGGRAYSSTIYRSADALPWVEYWVVHGAGHAWSGGSAAGSFTDPAGPDASAEMVRFFLSRTRP
jgi:poly(hydroxyalkanoate) depolymerase family esterase